MARSVLENVAVVGGGPAGLAPLIWAAREGYLSRLAAGGLVVVERGHRLGAGSIGDHAIGSDTAAATFLECLENGDEPRLMALRDHPAALAIAAHLGGPVPLPLVATFLETLGEALSSAILAAGGRVLTGCEALWAQQHADGGWQLGLRTAGGGEHVLSRHLVLATGAEQSRDALNTVSVAGETLLPRFDDKLLLSGEALAVDGPGSIAQRLKPIAAPRVAIIGGSHSALASANVLLNKCPEIGFGPGAITLIHRRPLRVFYLSAEAAKAEGYTDFDANDICPVSKRLFRLAGFRLEARELVMRALGIGGRAPEPRLRLNRLHGPASEANALRALEAADLIIAALGYQPRALPLFDVNRNRIPLALDGPTPAPLVDRLCRVLDHRRRPIPGVFGVGLAAGFVPSGSLGGEPSFRGQTNGIWLWQNGVGAIIVNALLNPEQDHVAA
jgi:hypothetical protein